ncbi:alpha-1,2-fucosyltransferase [Ruminococcus sp. OF02-6]|nr:alpha-1,2-fucosyltransferase [Ruminococcus sp. OF02-6]
MVVVKISDGFGNQLFQYAFGYALSRKLNTKLILDATVLDNHPTRNYELDKLNIKAERVISYKNWPNQLVRKILHKLNMRKIHSQTTFFKEKEKWKYDATIDKLSDNIYLDGYWQTEKYFLPYREELLELLSPNYQLSDDAKKYIKKVTERNSVSVHIRRGDYEALGNCINEGYYVQAIEKIINQQPDAEFFVFSDDLVYAEQFMRQFKNLCYELVKYKSDNLALDDFFIMSSCRTNIIANSTFSWWAAWLNKNPNKKIICPQIRNWSGDFYPEEWEKIICD